MTTFLKILGYLTLIVAGIASSSISFIDPTLTAAQVVIKYWYIILSSLVLAVLGLILINIAEK